MSDLPVLPYSPVNVYEEGGRVCWTARPKANDSLSGAFVPDFIGAGLD